MPTADVHVENIYNKQLYVRFEIGGIPYKFKGPMTEEIVHFGTDKAKLTYDSVKDFTGESRFEGQVGKEEITFTIHGNTSDLKVTGTLVTPLPQTFKFEGEGDWYVG